MRVFFSDRMSQRESTHYQPCTFFLRLLPHIDLSSFDCNMKLGFECKVRIFRDSYGITLLFGSYNLSVIAMQLIMTNNIFSS